MSTPQSFAAWLTNAPASWLRTVVRTRRDAVRQETAANIRFANALSSRAAVAVGVESLTAGALHALTRAAARSRVEPVVDSQVFGTSAAERHPVLTELLAAGLVWPAFPPTGGQAESGQADGLRPDDSAPATADPRDAAAFRVQPESVTLLPTSAAAAQSAPWWAAQTPAAPPAAQPAPVSAALALNAQAAAVTETLSTLHAVIRLFADSPASVLVSGGVSRRDLHTYANRLHLAPELAVFAIELARSLKLLGVGGDELDPLWLPTVYAEAFTAQARESSFAQAVHAWLTSPVDATHIVAGKNPAGERVHLLSNRTAKPAYAGFPTVRPATVFARFRILDLLADFSGGPNTGTPAESVHSGPDTGTPAKSAHSGPAGGAPETLPAFERADLLAAARFAHPLIGSFTAETVQQILAEAEFLGLVCSPLGRADSYALTPLGTQLTRHATAAMTGELAPLNFAAARLEVPADFEPAVRALLPQLQSTVVIQSDLTAIATGPLEPRVETVLEKLARVETRGQGTVFRFTSETVKAAFESGLSPAEVRQQIAEISATGVPGPLEFLIEDTAAKLHRVRVASARGAIVVDDPDDLDTILDDPLFAAAKLVRVAPTVAVAGISSERLTELLDAQGTPVLSFAGRGAARLAPMPVEPAAAKRSSSRLPDSKLAAFAAAVGSPQTRASQADAGAVSTVSAALREAISTGQAVDVVFVTGEGEQQQRVIVPRVLSGGRVRGRMLTGEGATEVTLSVGRIISARPHVTTPGGGSHAPGAGSAGIPGSSRTPTAAPGAGRSGAGTPTDSIRGEEETE